MAENQPEREDFEGFFHLFVFLTILISDFYESEANTIACELESDTTVCQLPWGAVVEKVNNLNFFKITS